MLVRLSAEDGYIRSREQKQNKTCAQRRGSIVIFLRAYVLVLARLALLWRRHNLVQWLIPR